MFGSTRNSENQENGESSATPPVGNNSSSSLSWETRVQCFIGAFILSVISSFCGSYLLMIMKLRGFAIMTSLSAVLSMTGTCFLMGPLSQLKSMFHKSRWLSSALYIFFIVMALISGLVLKNAPLAIICVVGEYIAMAWYSLSYIPYAREFISKMLCSCL